MRKKWLLSYGLTALAGTALHFVYDWWPNALTALLAPVNESVWEHLKLFYWPYLVSAWLLVRHQRDPWQAWGGHLAALPAMPLLVLGAYYALTAGFAVGADWVNIALYYLVLAAGFAIAWHIGSSAVAARLAHWLLLPVALLGLGLVLFTFDPPQLPVFTAP